MRIEHLRLIERGQLLAALKRTRLRGFGGALVYENASLEIETIHTDDLVPAQRYVLRDSVQKALELRQALLSHNIDIFALDGAVAIRTDDSPDEEIPVLPPIVEQSEEPNGQRVLLINDGIHRVYAARISGSPINVVVVRHVPTQFPYYAYALPGGWAHVTELAELPEIYQKKEYRDPTNYKALFRDFNALFPGVQKERKKSNPVHLRA